VDAGPVAECWWEYSKCTGVTSLLDGIGGQLVVDRVVPQFADGRFLHDGQAQRHPPQSLAVILLRLTAHQLQRGAQRSGTGTRTAGDPLRHGGQQ
jgi:hypothetical protein